MKDIGGVLVNGDSSSTNSSTLDNSGDDDYVFTEDQRRAALELQSLYRKLGLEDLDDGFEEGLSAYDDPHFDIVARLHEVNSRFEEDETPLESDRLRKVRFKETIVDLVVPISPVRNSHSPPEYDYSEYDDDFDDDFNTEDLRDMIDDEELLTRNDTDNQIPKAREEEEEFEGDNFVPDSNVVESSAPPNFFPVTMVDEGDAKEKGTFVENETKEEKANDDDSKITKQDFVDDKTKEENEDEKNEEHNFFKNDSKEEEAYDENDKNVTNGLDEEDYEEEFIHIMKISTEEEYSTNYGNSSNMKSLETETELKKAVVDQPENIVISQDVVEIPFVLGLVSEGDGKLEATDETKSDLESVSQDEQKLEICELNLAVRESVEQPKENKVNNETKRKDETVPYDQKPVSPLGTKPKRPSRMSSPPCKPRSTIKKLSPGPVLRTSVPAEMRQASAPVNKCGNSRSRYGLTEELRQELRRLKLLEAAQKKQREQEQAEERRRRQEDADSAFKAWLDMKKRTKSASTHSGRDSNLRSPTRKVRPAC